MVFVAEAGGADPRLRAPAAGRNREALRAALGPYFDGRVGLVLEIGSGTGEHVLDWAGAFPGLEWQPSDPDPAHRASIDAWAAEGAGRIRPAIDLDAAAAWPRLGPLAAVISVNVIHIAPWAVAEGIVAGAGALVAPGGLLIFYGPFREGGAHTGEGNARFDATLRAQNPAWGIRDLEAVADRAAAAGFGSPVITGMPANNRLVVFERPITPP